MHDNDDDPRVIRLVRQDDNQVGGEPLEFWGYDDGHRAGLRVGYRQGYADGKSRAALDADSAVERMTTFATWGMVIAFAVGGVFGVGMCRVMWPLVEAGVLP